MNLHILGIGGTFMSGIALLAKQSGYAVSGSDLNLYPPMSTQLANQEIKIFEGYDPAHISKETDCVIVGNVIRRGNPAIEYVLANQISYTSGPAWLYENILKYRHVLAVAGTHGKTTTTSLLTWILQSAGLKPGFLIGGIPENFGFSAHLGESPYFVIEADEYDAAFFDKRSKFIHYHPKTLILNNLEFDHADIFADLEAIKQQFHFLIKTIPGNGFILYHAEDENLQQVLQREVWTPTMGFAGKKAAWQSHLLSEDGSNFEVLYEQKRMGTVKWDLLGQHNVENALAAIAAAHHINVPVTTSIEALASFKNVKRRLEVKGQAKNITIYDDFAHHPTAIAKTLAGLRAKIGKKARIIAVLEFGSYTMRTGAHQAKIKDSVVDADMVVCKKPDGEWDLNTVFNHLTQPAACYSEVDAIVKHLKQTLQAGDHVVIMSNSGFGGIHTKLLNAIDQG